MSVGRSARGRDSLRVATVMDNGKPRRLDRAFDDLARLPAWQQCLLMPLVIPVRLLTPFPILLPTLCVGAAGVLAFLKQAYLHEQMSWIKVAGIATAPLWMFTAYGYAAVLAAGVGTIPLAIVLLFRHWRAGTPFTLWDPQPDVTAEVRAGLTERLRAGKGVTRDDIRAILAIRDAEARRLRIPFMVAFGSLVIGLAGVEAALYLSGGRDGGVRSLVLLLSFTTMLPIVYLRDSLDSRWLRCRQCRRTLARDALNRLLESDTCPACSAASPLAVRAKAASAVSDRDSEVW